MEQFDLGFIGLPNELDDLIIQFCYFPKTRVAQINSLATVCFVTSKALPVPERWKLCLTDSGNFNWPAFLRTEMQPYTGETLINLSEVRNTVKLLNWHHIKNLHTPAASWALFLQKKIVMSRLRSWAPCTYTLVFLIQRLLCSLDFPRCLNRVDPFQIDCCCVKNTNLLCMSMRPPQYYF